MEKIEVEVINKEVGRKTILEVNYPIKLTITYWWNSHGKLCSFNNEKGKHQESFKINNYKVEAITKRMYMSKEAEAKDDGYTFINNVVTYNDNETIEIDDGRIFTDGNGKYVELKVKSIIGWG